MRPKIIFIDTFYGDVLASVPEKQGSYKERSQVLADLIFGTSDFYSSAFNKYGWDASDIIANDFYGRQLWNRENCVGGLSNRESVYNQIMRENPDVVYFQDLSFFDAEYLQKLRSKRIKVVGQHSCPWVGNDQVRNYDFLYTSFPHYLDRFAKLKVEHDFLQIGFGGDKVLDKLPEEGKRPLDVSFVGGIGNHWNAGNALLETVARRVDEFQWWGYGRELLPDCLLRRIWQGSAWGFEMYRIYLRSKIVINRHGEVAEGYTNNMRCFEATGCGALLMTEASKNIDFYFEPGEECVTYEDADDLVEKIRFYLMNDKERERIALAGKLKTLESHTYQKILQGPAKTLAWIAGKEL